MCQELWFWWTVSFSFWLVSYALQIPWSAFQVGLGMLCFFRPLDPLRFRMRLLMRTVKCVVTGVVIGVVIEVEIGVGIGVVLDVVGVGVVVVLVVEVVFVFVVERKRPFGFLIPSIARVSFLALRKYRCLP